MRLAHRGERINSVRAPNDACPDGLNNGGARWLFPGGMNGFARAGAAAATLC